MAASSLLGQGIYGTREAARLIGADPDLVARWSTSQPARRALVEPSQGDIFSFHDLVSLLVARELWDRGVTTDDIRAGTEYLAEQLKTDRPLAHQGLATVGRQFFAQLGVGWYDAGRGGQGAFDSVIAADLRPITYGTDHLASLWRPWDHISLDPLVQAGSPCIENTRITTAMLASMADGEDVEDVAEDYDLSVEEVTAAIDYERELSAA